MTDMDTLIERLRAHAEAAQHTIDTGGRDEFDPRELPFDLPEAATALQQALAERDEAREGHAAARQNFHTMQGSAAELAAQVQRLTAALSEETEACAKLRARIEKFESIDIPVAFTGTIGPLTREGKVAIIVLEPPVLGCRYAVVRTETRGLIDLLMQFDGLTNLVGLPVEGEGFPGPDALLVAAIRSRKDKP